MKMNGFRSFSQALELGDVLLLSSTGLPDLENWVFGFGWIR